MTGNLPVTVRHEMITAVTTDDWIQRERERSLMR